VRDRLLGVAGVVIVSGAALWAAAGGSAAPVSTLVVIGVVFALADAAVWRVASDEVADLDVPPGQRLPRPPWTALVIIAAGIGAVGALAADVIPVAVGAGVVALAALAVLARPQGKSVLPARTAHTARRIRAFVRAHGLESGQPAEGYLTAVGESGSRLLVIAPDGAWADVMVGDDADAVTALARITLRQPDDPTTGHQLRIGPRLWSRMTDSW
jgi:hypothetical protein